MRTKERFFFLASMRVAMRHALAGNSFGQAVYGSVFGSVTDHPGRQFRVRR